MSVTWGKKLFIILALLSGVAYAQAVQPFSAVGPELLGSGYQPVGASAVMGVFVDTPRVFADPEADYITGGKEEGHTRSLQTDVFARFGGKYFIGPGVSWSKLYTPEFSKSSVHPRFGVGRDFTSGHANAVQGFDVQGFWFFGTRHIFLRMDLGTYWAHGTVIPVGQGGSSQSVAAELAVKTTTSFFQTALGWRW